jgi:hypothetical protein
VDIASFVQVYYLVPEVTWQQSSASGDVMRELGVYIPPSLSSLGPVLQVMFRLVSACFSLFSLTEHY